MWSDNYQLFADEILEFETSWFVDLYWGAEIHLKPDTAMKFGDKDLEPINVHCFPNIFDD